jgi:hypothetical protein
VDNLSTDLNQRQIKGFSEKVEKVDNPTHLILSEVGSLKGETRNSLHPSDFTQTTFSLEITHSTSPLFLL